MHLPIVSKTHVPEGMTGGNISVSYWYEASEKEGHGKGGVGLFISISGPDDFAGERSAKFMWDSYLEAYLYSEGTVGDVLRKSVKAAQQRLVDLIRHEAGVSEQGVDVHVCAFAIVDGAMSLILMGEPGVALVRNGKVIDLSEVVPSFSGEGLREEISVGNFALVKKDTLVISTPKLVQSFLGTLEESGDDEVVFLDWNKIIEELASFSQNLVGNQYIWTLGYGIEERKPEVDDSDEVTGGMAIEGGNKKIGQDGGQKDNITLETGGVNIADGAGFTHTLRGIQNGDGEEKIEDVDEVSKGPEVSLGATGAPLGVHEPMSETQKNTGVKMPVLNPAMKVRAMISGIPLRQKCRIFFNAMRRPDFIKRAGRALGARISALKMRGFRPLQQKKMFIGREESALSRIMKSKFALLIVFLILLALMVLYVWRQSKERERIAEVDSQLEKIDADIGEAELDWEAQQNRVAVEDALKSLSLALAELAKGSLLTEQVKKVEDLRNDIQSVYDLMDRVTPLTEENGSVKIITDLYLKIGENAKPTDFEKYGTYLYIVDNASHSVYRYSPELDSISQVANSAEVLKNPQYIAISSGYLFVYDVEVGMVMLDMNVNEPEWTFKVRPELSARTIGEVTEIAAYGEIGSPANIYILKRDEARVLKSSPAGSGYSFPEEYFRNGGFDKAVDILIDGNVYVYSNSSEKVYKYFIGMQDSFSISGLNVPLGKLCCGSTNVNDTGKLYIFDITNRRIISLEKPTSERHPGVGVLVKQYVYRGGRDDLFNDVKDIVVDIDERVLYVLDGTRVLQVLLDND